MAQQDTSTSQGQMPQYCQFEQETSLRCCTTSHDIAIKNYVQGLWPDECKKNVYPSLDKLVCLACHPEQPKYTDNDKKIVRVCESLLRQYYGNDNMDEPTTAFEQCGAWSSPDTTLDPIGPTKADGFILNSPDPELIFPKASFNNAREFYYGFSQAGIPFFGDFSIQAVPDKDENGVDNVCYKSATALLKGLTISAATVLALMSF